MKTLTSIFVLFLLLLMSALLEGLFADADAEVLCANQNNGNVTLRTTQCANNEAPINLAALVPQGTYRRQLCGPSEFECACESGEILISGGALCVGGDTISESIDLAATGNFWLGSCVNPNIAEDIALQQIAILCYRRPA
jgi:hypothetical protein